MQIEECRAELLQPISEQQPCGMPIRYEPEYDALREARREDDASLPAGVWQTDIKRADWVKVQQLAETVLRTRSKDLVVASWLGEAWLHLEGLPGLSRALALLALLCERFSEQLHPVPENGDATYLAGPLQWLAQHYAETLRIRVPLLTGVQPALTLDGWQRLHSRLLMTESGESEAKSEQMSLQQQIKKLQEAVDSLSENVLHEALEDISRSCSWLTRLDHWCTQSLAEEAPSFMPIVEVLQQMEGILLGLLERRPASASLQFQSIANVLTNPPADHVVNPLANAAWAATAPLPQAADTPLARGIALPPLNSREQAYHALQLIADYLSAIEPHSPVPYFLRTAVDWGSKPLPELLSELIEEDDHARRLWRQLGVLS